MYPDSPTPSSHTLQRLRRFLRAWYRVHARSLPWRGHPDPYAVLVSEFMLQQTQVATVLPYFERFLDRFPDPRSLAEASEEEVRTVWSGLGYYRRARFLQQSARVLMSRHQGRLPADLQALRELPGVGEYTAAALGSIVHDLPAAVVDGNVIRVVSRVFGVKDSVSREPGRSRVATLARELLPSRKSGDWNQAMMDLGAVICTPRAPRCEDCPWRRDCRAFSDGDPEGYPVKDAPRATVEVQRVVGILRRGPEVLLARRSDPKLLDGTWEFPGLDLPPGADPGAPLAAHLGELWRREVRVGAELARVRHAITHRRLVVRAFAVHLADAGALRAAPDASVWVSGRGLEDHPTSSMTVKLMHALAPLLERSDAGESAWTEPGKGRGPGRPGPRR